MDDPRLVYGTDAQVEETLRTIADLGVDRVRVSVFWKLVAPRPESKGRPDFDAADPAAYPSGSWHHYDRLVRGAERHGLDLLFSITGPAPLWATGTPERASVEKTWFPSPAEYGLFTRAVGRRYGGGYAAGGESPLPRVTAWSLWNEPNHPGWLTPQWLGRSRPWPAAPHHYRAMAGAAWNALRETGHESDIVLIGETAPRGWRGRKLISALRPLEFARELYCLDARGRPFTGGSARTRGCPANAEERRAFVASNPALFGATGWAHHAYGFRGRPGNAPVSHVDDAQLAELPSLARTLDRALARYGQGHRLHLWITEYGYETSPPDPFSGVSWPRQAAYLNEAAYIAYRNPRVASMAQFLLYDDVPWAHFPAGERRHWATFQTGLITAGGVRKPSFDAYALPIHAAPARLRRGRRVRVFGQSRGAASAARVEFSAARGGARVSTVARASANGRGFVEVSLRPRTSGHYRIVWSDPATGQERATRPVLVRVGRR
ncbi:MAG TPA: hypothetical protein VNT32_08710 [Thermoleophilaceae bacterium]|nr:hypothetical protein [Thermoleophilaceae bacterium]